MTDVLAKIAKSGVYEVPLAFYHSNCCDGPSLSSSGARLLVEECPALFWHTSPLNPLVTVEQKREFDFGSAAHLLTLEPDQWKARVVIVEGRTKDGRPSAGYASQDAKDQRAVAYKAGKIPLLPEEADQIREMRARLMAHPIASRAFRGGHAERSYFSRDAATGIWLKSRPDYTAGDAAYLVEYKSTTDPNPRSFERRAFDLGYYQQAAWSLDGVEAATGVRPRDYFLVAQGSKQPFLVTVFRLAERSIEWGQRMNRRAIDLFSWCWAEQSWPGYRDPRSPQKDTALPLDLPGYAEFQLQARHEVGEFERIKPSQKMLRLAEKAQAPL